MNERAATLARALCGSALVLGFASCRVAPEDAGAAEDAAVVDEPAAVAPWSPDEGHAMPSNAGTYWVSVLGPDGGFPLNEEFDVVVRVLDGPTRSRVVRDAQIRVDARMPAHGHGMKHDATLEPQPDGSWLARGMLLHMVGHWEIYVDLRRGPVTERAQLDVDLE
jgi:hypothetical protein